MEIDWESNEQPSAQVNKFVRAGTHEFKIVEAIDGVSKNNNKMVTLRMRAISGPDAGLHVKDFFVYGHSQENIKMAHHIKAQQLLRQLASAVGIERKFDTAELVAICIGKQVKATVFLQPSDDYINTRVRSFSKSDNDADLGDASAPDCPF